MDNSNFVQSHINYVFEHNLKEVSLPAKSYKLVPFNEVLLAEYQKYYYKCSKRDPQVDLNNLILNTYLFNFFNKKIN